VVGAPLIFVITTVIDAVIASAGAVVPSVAFILAIFVLEIPGAVIRSVTLVPYTAARLAHVVARWRHRIPTIITPVFFIYRLVPILLLLLIIMTWINRRPILIVKPARRRPLLLKHRRTIPRSKRVLISGPIRLTRRVFLQIEFVISRVTIERLAAPVAPTALVVLIVAACVAPRTAIIGRGVGFALAAVVVGGAAAARGAMSGAAPARRLIDGGRRAGEDRGLLFLDGGDRGLALRFALLVERF